MKIRILSVTGLTATLLVGHFVLPEPADARSYRRRNYATEWEQEEREDRYRQEREEQRQLQREHELERQKMYMQHQEKQLDKVIDHHERTGHFGLQEPIDDDPPPPAKKGTCIYGAGNKVLYQPKGVVCDHGN